MKDQEEMLQVKKKIADLKKDYASLQEEYDELKEVLPTTVLSKILSFRGLYKNVLLYIGLTIAYAIIYFQYHTHLLLPAITFALCFSSSQAFENGKIYFLAKKMIRMCYHTELEKTVMEEQLEIFEKDYKDLEDPRMQVQMLETIPLIRSFAVVDSRNKVGDLVNQIRDCFAMEDPKRMQIEKQILQILNSHSPRTKLEKLYEEVQTHRQDQNEGITKKLRR